MSFRTLAAAGLGLLAGAVSAAPQSLPKEPTSLYAVTTAHELIHVDPRDPATVLRRVSLSGLTGGDSLRGIDYRVARGVLYALGSSGQLYTVDTASGALTTVGDGKLAGGAAGRALRL